jgi:hypothetical protein
MPVCGKDPRVADHVLAPRYAHELKNVDRCQARDGAAARSSRERLKTGMPPKSTAIRNGEQPQASPLYHRAAPANPTAGSLITGPGRLVFIAVQQGLFGVYLGSSSAPSVGKSARGVSTSARPFSGARTGETGQKTGRTGGRTAR